MTPSSHLWASAMIQCPNSQWEPVITSGFNPSLSVCHICCALLSFCCLFPEALYHHPFLLTLIQPTQTTAPAFFHSVRNEHFQKQHPLLPLLTNQHTSAASEKSKGRQTEPHARLALTGLFENVLNGKTTADSFQTLFNISLSPSLCHFKKYHSIFVCGVCCGHIAQVLMCLKRKRLYKCKI